LKTLENNKSRVKDDFKFCEHTFFEGLQAGCVSRLPKSVSAGPQKSCLDVMDKTKAKKTV
jgi:hypothetical protein